MYMNKIDCLINFPKEHLNLKDYTAQKKSTVKYDLYGVIQHFGSLNGGHYTAICKNDNNWVIYNDSKLDFIDSML